MSMGTCEVPRTRGSAQLNKGLGWTTWQRPAPCSHQDPSMGTGLHMAMGVGHTHPSYTSCTRPRVSWHPRTTSHCPALLAAQTGWATDRRRCQEFLPTSRGEPRSERAALQPFRARHCAALKNF